MLDSCINSLFEPGNPGNATDSGTITVPRFPMDVAVAEAAAAVDTVSVPVVHDVSVTEAATADSTQDGTVTGAVPSRSAMIIGAEPVFVNPSVSREAYVGGVMVNL